MLEIGWNNFRAAPPAKPSCKSPHTRYSSTSSSPLVEEDVHEPCSAEASQNAHTGIQLENSTFLAILLNSRVTALHNANVLDMENGDKKPEEAYRGVVCHCVGGMIGSTLQIGLQRGCLACGGSERAFLPGSERKLFL
jgi:hypothetical protein